MTFRDAVVGVFPSAARRSFGLVVEVIAILATVFGLATSFAFAAMQLTSGISETFGVANSGVMRVAVIVAIGVVAAISVYIGIDRGMKRISEVNSILSIILVVVTAIAGPTLYILSIVPQTVGEYGASMLWMGLWTDAGVSSAPIESWMGSWNGVWTVFIWCWCWAFSPFVGSFIARISRGRTIREFVVGVLGFPSLICVLWIGVLGGAAMYYDEASGGTVSEAVSVDTSLGLFSALAEIPIGAVSFMLLLIATVLVGTYYVTSLDSGVHALAGFVSSSTGSAKVFRVALVAGIAVIATLLLTIGGESVVGTVQTGTIIGALPYTLVVLIMLASTIHSTGGMLAERK